MLKIAFKGLLPGLKKLVIYSLWVGFLYSVFFMTYMPVNRLNMIRDFHLHLYFPWETKIPMISGFMFFYASIVVAFGLPLFLLKLPDIHLLGFRFLVIMLTSTIFFIVMPTVNGFPREVPDGLFRGFYAFLFDADKPYNLFPSLHISFSATLGLSMSKLRSGAVKFFVWVWLGLVCASVVFVHQHHIADIVGGLVLSLLAMRYITRTPGFFRGIGEKIYKKVRARISSGSGAPSGV